jgi:hypothetical protein
LFVELLHSWQVVGRDGQDAYSLFHGSSFVAVNELTKKSGQ